LRAHIFWANTSYASVGVAQNSSGTGEVLIWRHARWKTGNTAVARRRHDVIKGGKTKKENSKGWSFLRDFHST